MSLETPDRVHATGVVRITQTLVGAGPPPSEFLPSFDTSHGFSSINLPSNTNPEITRMGLVSAVAKEQAVIVIGQEPDPDTYATVSMGPPTVPTGEPLMDDTPVDQIVARVEQVAQYNPDTVGSFWRFTIMVLCLPITEPLAGTATP